MAAETETLFERLCAKPEGRAWLRSLSPYDAAVLRSMPEVMGPLAEPMPPRAAAPCYDCRRCCNVRTIAARQKAEAAPLNRRDPRLV